MTVRLPELHIHPSHPIPPALPEFMDNEDLEKLGEVYTTFTQAKCTDEVLRYTKRG